MVKKSQIDRDEINLIELISTVWEGKWKIAVAVVISFIAAISYQSIKSKNFTTITEIQPVSSSALYKYTVLNNTIKLADTVTNSSFQKITELSLLNLYIDILNDKSIFEDGMHKLNFLDASQYSDEQEYNEAIIKLAASIKILSPLIDKKKEGNLEISYHTINFEYDDVEKWKRFLIYVDKLANQLVKNKILEDFSNTLSFLKQDKEYQLEKLKTSITNTQIDFDKEMKKFDMNREFQIEDTQTKIDNAFLDYDRKTASRLAFLREQASIARKLEIAKNTIEVQTFGTKNGMVANIKTDTPFYLRGYEAIEKEIELIELRDDKQAFVGGLLKLEQEKRSLEQDRTLLRIEKNKVFLDSLIELEKKKRIIEQDKTLERIELAFQSTPLANNNEFSARLINNEEFFATSTNALSTKIIYKDNNILILTIVIGLIVGVFYVIISDAFQTHSVSRKKTN
jgi:LPS O-antigen subunit length determinant protein (WzzB/FepE family)